MGAVRSASVPTAAPAARSRAGIGKWAEVLLVAGVVACALFLRLYDLTGESLWYDETYSLWIADMDLDRLAYLWEWPVQFPAYYVLLYHWLRAFGMSDLSVRLFGALAGALTVLPAYWLGKALFGRRVGAISALLLAVNPYHVWYSQEVRMHSWAVLLTLISVYACWRMVNGGRWGWWALHLLSTALTFHLHYYVGFAVLAENLYVAVHLWAKRGGLFTRESWRWLRWWLLEQVGLFLLMVPGVIVFLIKLLDLNEWGWLSQRYGPPGLLDILNLLEAYTLGVDFPGPSFLAWTMIGLSGALIVWGVWRRWRTREEKGLDAPLVFSLIALGLPLVACFVAGQFSTVWVTRYLLPFQPFFLILMALGLSAIPWQRAGNVLLVLICAVSLYALGNMYSVQQKEDWRGVASYMTPQFAKDDLIVLMDNECRVPFSHYFGSGGTRIEISRFADDATLDEAVVTAQRKQRGGRLWVVVSHADSQSLEQRLEALPELSFVKRTTFVGIQLIEYAWS